METVYIKDFDSSKPVFQTLNPGIPSQKRLRMKMNLMAAGFNCYHERDTKKCNSRKQSCPFNESRCLTTTFKTNQWKSKSHPKLKL